MKLELLNGLFFIGLVILLSGCTYSEPKDQWYQHPGKYYSLGLAYIGTSFLPDPVQAEKDAEAEAIAGLASSLRSRIEGVDKDWMVMQGKKQESLNQEKVAQIVRLSMRGVKKIKVERDPTTGTTYCLVALESPTKYLNYLSQEIHGTTLQKSKSTNWKKLIEREKNSLDRERKKIWKTLHLISSD